MVLKNFIILYVNLLIIIQAHIQLVYYIYIRIFGTGNTTIDSDFLINFPLYVQNIDPPELTVAGTQLQSPIGNFTYLNNVSVNSSTNTVRITFMDTEKSIHEHAIYTWMEKISDFTTNFIPRLDMAIKVYYSDVRILKSNDKKNDKYGYQLNYIYFFSGCFPTQFETSKLKQTVPDAGSFSRPVTFSFNNMVVLRNKDLAEKRKLEYLWTDHILETKLSAAALELAELKKELASLNPYTSHMYRVSLEQRIYELETELGDS